MKVKKIEICLGAQGDTEVVRYYGGTAEFALDETRNILENSQHRNEIGVVNRCRYL